jgi:hypothetical protein
MASHGAGRGEVAVPTMRWIERGGVCVSAAGGSWSSHGGWISRGWAEGWSSHGGRSSRGGDCVSADGGKLVIPRGVDLERVGGRVVVPRWPELERGAGRESSSGPRARYIDKRRFTVSFSSSSSWRLVAEAVRSGQLPQPGWGKATPALAAPGSRPWPRPGLRAGLRGRVRTYVRLRRAACGLACGSARAGCGFAWPGSCDPHPPPPPSDQRSRGWREGRRKRNDCGQCSVCEQFGRLCSCASQPLFPVKGGQGRTLARPAGGPPWS